MTLPQEDFDYFVHVLPFGVPIPAFVRLNTDGTYSLYLNSEYDFEHWVDSYEHELWHMIRDDLHGEKDIRDIEDIGRGA